MIGHYAIDIHTLNNFFKHCIFGDMNLNRIKDLTIYLLLNNNCLEKCQIYKMIKCKQILVEYKYMHFLVNKQLLFTSVNISHLRYK